MIEIMFEDLFSDAAGQWRVLEPGAALFRQSDRVRAVFAVAEGMVDLIRRQADGGAIVLHRAGPGTLLAEASVYASAYHCDAVAARTSRLVEIPKAAFLARLDADRVFAARWEAHLARAVQAARYRAELLSLKTVAERLDGWLAWPGNAPPAKGEGKALAAQLGVSPEALYRELAKRRARR